MALPDPILFTSSKNNSLLDQIAQIHIDCILHDHTVATFLPQNGIVEFPPVLDYWLERAAQVDTGTRDLILQFTDASESEIMGYVSLHPYPSQTGPFRASVEKLLVSPRHRRRGVARRLMQRLEDVARERGAGMLTLDTELGSTAASMYPKLGYTALGVIPKYSLSPKDGGLVDELFFYKDLRE